MCGVDVLYEKSRVTNDRNWITVVIAKRDDQRARQTFMALPRQGERWRLELLQSP